MVDLFDTLPSVPFTALDELPHLPAIYFALDGQRRVLYIGKSVDLHQRWKGHHRHSACHEYRCQRIYWRYTEEAHLDQYEREAIAHFCPLLNGGGDQARRQQKLHTVFIGLPGSVADGLAQIASRNQQQRRGPYTITGVVLQLCEEAVQRASPAVPMVESHPLPSAPPVAPPPVETVAPPTAADTKPASPPAQTRDSWSVWLAQQAQTRSGWYDPARKVQLRPAQTRVVLHHRTQHK